MLISALLEGCGHIDSYPSPDMIMPCTQPSWRAVAGGLPDHTCTGSQEQRIPLHRKRGDAWQVRGRYQRERFGDLLQIGEETDGAAREVEPMELEGDQEAPRGHQVLVELADISGYCRALRNQHR